MVKHLFVMKTFLFTLSMICCLLNVSRAQDTLFFKTGERELIEVKEIANSKLMFKSLHEDRDILHSVNLYSVKRLHMADGKQYAMVNGVLELVNETPRVDYLVKEKKEIQPVYQNNPVFPRLGRSAPADEPQYLDKAIRLNGPRIGFTYLNPVPETDVFDIHGPMISQFGWQFETRYFTLENGSQGLIEFVGLIGGLEQNIFLPSLSMLFGYRSPGGTEFAAGPNLNLEGFGFVVAVGHTFKSEHVYFPVNVAVAPSPDGVKLSLLCGFNARNKWR